MKSRTILHIIAVTIAFMPISLGLAQSSDKEPVKADVELKEAASPQAVGHLEVSRDPYIPMPREGRATTPAKRLVSRDGYVSVQVNVDEFGNNIVDDAANEPTIAVDPTNPQIMAIGWRQFDTITSNFRQAGWGYTTDGGRNWTFPGVVEPGHFRSDPVMDSDAQGNFYYNSLTNEGGYQCKVFKSTDGGQTWNAGVFAQGGDKQWQEIDKTNGPGQGHIYASWNSFYSICDGHFTRSTDGGQSFEPCTYAPSSPYWGTLSVGPTGELYLSGQGFIVCRSDNAQNAGQTITWSSASVNLGGSIVFSAGPNPGGLLGQSWVAADYSQPGYVYMLCSVDPAGSDPLDIMFSRSTDGGTTWSAPLRINDDPAGNNAWQWFGTLSVAPNGRIDVIWLDTRGDPGGYDSVLYYSFSDDSGTTWSPNEALSLSFDPHVGWPQQNKLGDYFDMWSDDMGACVAYAGTFNGEQDVYYIRIGDTCFDAGTVTLDRPKYACESTANLMVNDCGLNTDDLVIESYSIPIDSDSETGVESVLVTETAADTGVFEGAIDLSETNAPGVLLVAPDDTVTATYIDADDGEGHYNVVVTATATVDCTRPTISNVQAINVEPRSADITFDCDELAKGTVYYGLSCGSLTETATSGFAMSPVVALSGLQDNMTYFYAVEAEDEAGNVSYDDNGGVCYTFTTPEVPDFFTEQDPGDLDDLKLIFVPNGSNDFYMGCVEDITALPTDPTGGTAISLSDDDSELISFSGTAWLYGVSYSSCYV
ncbi:MAG: exo-alpha-sialidase, partial [Phycisphaerae bacterium]|nr:exo-alpha-sialidase [Phycisphaerae bacterium]